MQIKYIASGLIALAISGALAAPVAAPEPLALAEPAELAARDWDVFPGEDWHDEHNEHDHKLRARDLDVDLPEFDKRSPDAPDFDKREAIAEPSDGDVTDGGLARRAEQAVQWNRYNNRWNNWNGRRYSYGYNYRVNNNRWGNRYLNNRWYY